MPQFVLDYGTANAATTFSRLSDFTRGYIEAMFFTESGSDDISEDAAFSDLDSTALATIEAECQAFQTQHFGLLCEAAGRDYDDMQAGRDFWFTRNGHGVGYWDRDQLDGTLGEALSDAARGFGEVYLYQGDDARLYV